ncbi:hypothetical protein [Microcoleus phage My-WqHQDG]|nr:hypothetical protein [Microcoleus phage My-WqHQDG]
MHKYPKTVEMFTPTGTMSMEWKTACARLGIARAKALLRSWETNAKGVGVFVQSYTYGCMDYWSISGVTYYRESPVKSNPSVEASWSRLRKVLLHKLF